jgi:hypothetical protein
MKKSKAKLGKAQIKEGRSSVLGVQKFASRYKSESHTGESERSYFDWDEPHQVWEKVQEDRVAS